MPTREVAQAQADLEEVERVFKQATGLYQTRREHAKARLQRALDVQTRLQEEAERIRYTLRSAFGHMTLYGRVFDEPGGRATFITQTSQEELRRRLREIDRRLNEVRG